MTFLDRVNNKQLVEQEIQNGVGKVSQSLARKILHVWRDYSRCQWTIAETTIVCSLCIGVNELSRFLIFIFFSGLKGLPSDKPSLITKIMQNIELYNKKCFYKITQYRLCDNSQRNIIF